MSGLMAECVETCDRQPSTASANLIQTALSSCCVPVPVAWVLTSLLLTPVLYLTLTGTLKMTCRYENIGLCTIVYLQKQKLLLQILRIVFFAHRLNAYFFLTSFCQAQARCHRIGQSKAVKVYRLITRNSYEREMLDKASLKLGLDRAVLQSMSGNKDSNVNGVRNQSL